MSFTNVLAKEDSSCSEKTMELRNQSLRRLLTSVASQSRKLSHVNATCYTHVMTCNDAHRRPPWLP